MKTLKLENKGSRTGARTSKPKAKVNKSPGKARKTPNKATASAKPAGISTGKALAIYNQGMASGRAQGRAAALVPNKGGKKKGTARKHKRNGSNGGLLGGVGKWFSGGYKLTANPNMGEFTATARIAAVGLLGGCTSKAASAVVLALGDRFAAKYTDNKWLSPVLTIFAALFVTPRILGYFGMAPDTQRLATTGGIIFGAGEALNAFTEGDKINELADAIRTKVRTIGGGSTEADAGSLAAATADAARTAAVNAGMTPQQANKVAASAAQGTLSGLGQLRSGGGRRRPRLVRQDPRNAVIYAN